MSFNMSDNTFQPTFLHYVCPIFIIALKIHKIKKLNLKNPQIKFKNCIKMVHFKSFSLPLVSAKGQKSLKKG